MSDTPPPASPRTIEVARIPAELYKVLQLAGVADSGGAAKALVAEGRVRVNGEVETRKRKKLLPGDRILYGDREWQVVLRATGA